MTRRLTFIFSLGAALAFPAIASANCGTIQGSFSVTCEQGVQVFRHNALSGVPRGISRLKPLCVPQKSAPIRIVFALNLKSAQTAGTRIYGSRSLRKTIFARGFSIVIPAVSTTVSALATTEVSVAASAAALLMVVILSIIVALAMAAVLLTTVV